ncbi:MULTISPECIES: ferritin-like domain-containing protein [Bacillus]|uniref:ferritin-like domain-containing protein n=1 Tax=Bacillus TaxID=1386 RepID=UPI000D160E93|nr:ferritin-like domain-containing protein [Bacillus wiedmannii]HDR7224691.1 ferritin-like domain-containing protein [Bacillus toyonensis]PTC10780.1 rubrerythrin family protein [Bacillus wiedmannii]HDR7343782.1 ferritin-like domain-containing protein [Bacillus toyonensis]HDR7401490.1 ferritin-like domain-containing protein [Bacillus toyonensis]HDR7504626.1 ferritin-like domain-containing protein [Bacillus toyonensis]
MEKKSVVNTLNAFLKGQYMGIHTYEHYIEKLKDTEIKKEFQRIQQDHKQHALKVAERIQNLGGVPVDSEGMVGSVQGLISQFTVPNTTEGIVSNALKGEGYYGIQISEEIVQGDLDPESHMLIHDILDKDREHVNVLKQLKH